MAAKAAFSLADLDAWVLGDWVVVTTGEPLPNDIKYLQKSAGKMCSLNRNGYFKSGPHLRRIGLLIRRQPRPKQIQYHGKSLSLPLPHFAGKFAGGSLDTSRFSS
jgi:hypothetical protein